MLQGLFLPVINSEPAPSDLYSPGTRHPARFDRHPTHSVPTIGLGAINPERDSRIESVYGPFPFIIKSLRPLHRAELTVAECLFRPRQKYNFAATPKGQ